MSVQNAIACYGTLVGPVFSHVKQIDEDGRFKASNLEKAIKAIVKKQTGQENEVMMGMPFHGKGCKT